MKTYEIDSAPEAYKGDEPIGWEVVAAESGKMSKTVPVPEKSDTVDEQEITPRVNDENAGERKEVDPEVISRIDEYMMSSSEDPNMMAHYVADLAGVAAGIKPTALIQILVSAELNLDSAELASMIQSSGLCVADGWENGKFFVSKSPELAEKTKGLFQKLWNHEITEDEDSDLGRLLGYPETAVTRDFRKPTTAIGRLKGVFQKKENPRLARYYVHSPEHQEEEFELYERPLHKYMDEHCPRAAAVLKKEEPLIGKSYRW